MRSSESATGYGTERVRSRLACNCPYVNEDLGALEVESPPVRGYAFNAGTWLRARVVFGLPSLARYRLLRVHLPRADEWKHHWLHADPLILCRASSVLKLAPGESSVTTWSALYTETVSVPPACQNKSAYSAAFDRVTSEYALGHGGELVRNHHVERVTRGDPGLGGSDSGPYFLVRSRRSSDAANALANYPVSSGCSDFRASRRS